MKRYGLLVLVAVVSMLAAGCGGGAQAASNKINVTMTDFHFTPDAFTIGAGQEIEFTGRNNGAVTHDFVIMKLGTDVGDNFDKDDEANIFWEAELTSGQNVNLTFTAPAEPGEYQVVCAIPGHYQAGMVGKLVVTAP